MTQAELPIAGSGGRPAVTLTPECPECKETFGLEVDLWKGKILRILPVQRAPRYFDLMRVLERYKAIKGYDGISTWDGRFKGRALKSISRILWFFRKLPAPTDVAIECLEEMAKDYDGKGITWYIETISERADDWLARKQKNGR